MSVTTQAGKELVRVLRKWAKAYPDQFLEGWELEVEAIERQARRAALKEQADLAPLRPDLNSAQMAREIVQLVLRSNPEAVPYHTRVRRERDIAQMLDNARTAPALSSETVPDEGT